MSSPSRIGRSAAVAAAACGVLLAGGCGGSAHSQTTPARPSGPVVRSASSRPSLISIFEDPARLAAAPGPTLDALRALGAEYVRLSIPWAGLAPDPSAPRPPPGFIGASPASYSQRGWKTYDAIVEAATARGMGVDLDPTAPAPRWANAHGEPAGGPRGIWRPSAALFGQFVRAVGVRYSGRYTPPGATAPLPRVGFWSIWNEPNYGSDLAPQAVEDSALETSPMLYRHLLDAAWGALQATGHRRDTILIGELAPGGNTGPGYPGDFGGMVPLRFLRALYCVNAQLSPLSGAAAALRGCPRSPAGSKRFVAQHPALFHASGVAVHPYSQGNLAPNLVTPDEPDYANLAALPRFERTLDALQAVYGLSTRFDIYSTEYGYKTNPPYIAGAPLAQATGYLNWAEYLSYLDPRIRSFDQYLLADPPASGPSRFDTGLEFANGSPKPSLAAFRLPLYLPEVSAPRGGPLEVWGCVRPVRYFPGADTAQVQFRPRAGGPFRTLATAVVTAGDCYFDIRVRFPSSGIVELAWSYRKGEPAIHSRQVAITVS